MYIHHHRGIIPPHPMGGLGTRDTGPYIYWIYIYWIYIYWIYIYWIYTYIGYIYWIYFFVYLYTYTYIIYIQYIYTHTWHVYIYTYVYIYIYIYVVDIWPNWKKGTGIKWLNYGCHDPPITFSFQFSLKPILGVWATDTYFSFPTNKFIKMLTNIWI